MHFKVENTSVAQYIIMGPLDLGVTVQQVH